MNQSCCAKRKFRTLKLESLEHRELMAADVATADLNNGVLQITGTNNPDNLQMRHSGSLIWVGLGNSSKTFPSDSVRSLRVDLKGGNDGLGIGLNFKSFDSIFIDMGLGSNEKLDVRFGNTSSLTINAVNSLHTSVVVQGTVTNVANIDYGNNQDPGNDRLQIQNSTISNLNVKMGGGADTMTLLSSRIDRAMISLGSGDDDFTNNQSNIISGIVDGESSVRRNIWRGNRFGRAVTVRGF